MPGCLRRDDINGRHCAGTGRGDAEHGDSRDGGAPSTIIQRTNQTPWRRNRITASVTLVEQGRRYLPIPGRRHAASDRWDAQQALDTNQESPHWS